MAPGMSPQGPLTAAELAAPPSAPLLGTPTVEPAAAPDESKEASFSWQKQWYAVACTADVPRGAQPYAFTLLGVPVRCCCRRPLNLATAAMLPAAAPIFIFFSSTSPVHLDCNLLGPDSQPVALRGGPLPSPCR